MNSDPSNVPYNDSGDPEEALTALPVAPAPDNWWNRIGGGSLTISIIVHAVVILIAVLVVITKYFTPPEPIQFLPGGGGGGKGNDARMVRCNGLPASALPRHGSQLSPWEQMSSCRTFRPACRISAPLPSLLLWGAAWAAARVVCGEKARAA